MDAPVIEIAAHAGVCYGVERALTMALDAAASAADGHAVSTLGPLIHNPLVVHELAERGVVAAPTAQEAAPGTLVIRAHGVTPAAIEDARERGLAVLDAPRHRLQPDGEGVVHGQQPAQADGEDRQDDEGQRHERARLMRVDGTLDVPLGGPAGAPVEDHEEQAGHFWHIRYPIVGTDRSLVIATTRRKRCLEIRRIVVKSGG